LPALGLIFYLLEQIVQRSMARDKSCGVKQVKLCRQKTIYPLYDYDKAVNVK